MSGPLEGRGEPAGMLGLARRGRRSERARAWDRENRPTSYRLDPAVPERVREVQSWYKERGYSVSLSQLAEDLLIFALDAWDEGEVLVNVREVRPRRLAVGRD